MQIFGKVCLLFSIMMQAHLLYSDQAISMRFETNVIRFQEDHSETLKYFMNEGMVGNPVILRLVVCGLLSSIVLVFLVKKLTILPITGILIFIATAEYDQHQFFKNLAILGGMMIWASNLSKR